MGDHFDTHALADRVLPGADGEVHYGLGASQGPCIVFTHGATMDRDLFAPQVAHFSRDWKVLAWDVPAHGRSRPWNRFSLDSATERLAAILDREEIEDVHLVGQSMGGYLSQVFAKRYPDRVKSIVSVGSSPMARRYFSRMDLWLLARTPAMLRCMPRGLLIRMIAKQVALTPESRAYALATLETYSLAEISAIMSGVAEAVLAFGDESARPPALLITLGDRERTGKVRAYCARWHEEEGWPLVEIEHAAHNANRDNPGAFNRVLEAFLGEVEGRRRN